ncbi:MAG TPA: hypothetical protein EYN06_09475 [Myxococcales bacterium]|nr:hypothetical protein [Myxococcales bacterium]HIN86699.1 hypothetical protein [Myxococcales bacterium]
MSSGCTRVPGKSLPRLSISKKKKKGATTRKVPLVKVEATEVEYFEDELDENDSNANDISTLCGDACEHWATLRFPMSPHVNNVHAKARSALQRILRHQREEHADQCEESCIQADNRARAQCILLVEQANEITRCLRL